MEHEILYDPSYALLVLSLDAGESITAETGAMVSHSEGIEISTQKGGDTIMDSVKRRMGGDETFFVNTFTATRPGHVTLAPPLPGDLTVIHLEDEMILAQSGAYVAGPTDLRIDTRFGGAKTFFTGDGLSLLEIEGSGDLFMSSFGAIHQVYLEAGETYTVDTDHMVAFEDRVEFSISKVGDLKSSMISGEGVVCKFEGPGTVWLQSRTPQSFMSWIVANIPRQVFSKQTALDLIS